MTVTTLKDFESASYSKEMLKDTIAFIGAQQLSANPVNYTVCYEYLLGNALSLKQTIDKVLSENTPLTDLMMEQWFAVFFATDERSDLRRSQVDLMTVISKLTESAICAETNVIQFNQVLRLSENELVDSHTSLETIVANLLDNTRTLQTSMELMQQQMQESKQDMNSLQERLERTTEEALFDPLTGLTHHQGLTETIEKALRAADGSKSYPCLLVITIDHFKKANATYGLLWGDSVIKAVADTLKNQIKGKDTAAGYGSEAFCVLLPETELTDAVKVAENIRLAVERIRLRRSCDNQALCCLAVSIGVTQYRQDETILSWFERTEEALDQSQNEGRNRVTWIR